MGTYHHIPLLPSLVKDKDAIIIIIIIIPRLNV